MEYVIPIICAVAITSAIYALYQYHKFQTQQSNNIPKRILKEMTKLNKRDKDFIQNYLCQSIIILHNMFLKSDLAGEEFGKATIPIPYEYPVEVSIKRKVYDNKYTNIEILDTGVYTTAKAIEWEVFIRGRSAAIVKWTRTSLLGGTKIHSSVSDILSLKIIEALSYDHLVRPFEEEEY